MLLSAYVTVPISHFVAMKLCGMRMFDRLLVMDGVRAVISVTGVEVIVHVAMEIMRTMEPGPRPDKHSAGEPFRPVIAVRGAAVGRGFVVAVRACGSYADAYADLGVGWGRGCYEETQTGNSGESKDFQTSHEITSSWLERVDLGGVVWGSTS